MEERLERLESLVALQDRTIEKLNDALSDQQQQLLDMENKLSRMAGKIREMDDMLEQGGHENAPPPHYNG